MIQNVLERVSAERIRRDLFHLCCDPLRFRKVNHTRSGQNMNSLAEADAARLAIRKPLRPRPEKTICDHFRYSHIPARLLK